VQANLLAETTQDRGGGPLEAHAHTAHTVHAASFAAQRLRESDLELIQRTLQACGGNLSTAARQLGVSRGLIYRRLRAAREDCQPEKC
jgi:transcriptional regulator of acetoin/glycerol metabolism